MKISETGRMGNRTEWEYDAYGRIVREKSPDGYEVRHEYDQKHDLVRTLDSDGRETQYEYDQNHNLTLLKEKISGGQWRETAKTYDAKGRCISEKDALGNETVMEYDDNRTYPRRVITPKGEETAYTYDRVGRRWYYVKKKYKLNVDFLPNQWNPIPLFSVIMSSRSSNSADISSRNS